MEGQDILIIGAGIFGISTAYHLALRNHYSPNSFRITLLDRETAPSTPAASTNVNKIIRADYSSPLYMSLGFEAIVAWNNLPFFRNAGVFHQTGWIAMDDKDSDVPQRVRKNFLDTRSEGVIVEMTEEEYVANMLDGVSNGPEKDQAWRWRPIHDSKGGVHEKLVPTRLFQDFA